MALGLATGTSLFKYPPMTFEAGDNEVFSFSDRISVKAHSIVSTTLCKSDGGRVVAFALDEGEVLSEHRTNMLALLQVVSGEVQVTVGGTDHRLGAGKFILLPPDIPHSVKALAQVGFLLVMLQRTHNK